MQGRVSPVTRKGLSLLPRFVLRHQHLPLGRQPWSPERSTHFSLYFKGYNRLFRTSQTSLPDYTSIYNVFFPLMSESSDNHTNPRTISFLRESVHHNVSDSYNEHLTLELSQYYINLRLLLSRIFGQLPDSTCHRKRPQPVRRQFPTTAHDIAKQPRTTVYDLFRAQYTIPVPILIPGV